MNDTNLEHQLRSLQPAAPSEELKARVQRDLALAELFRESAPEAAAHKASSRWAWMSAAAWAGLGAAAAVLVMALLPGGATSLPTGSVATTTPASVASSDILPVSSSREWVDVEDEGITFATPDNPERRMRVRSVERHQWIDPRDGAEYTVEVPQVESVALPVKFQ